jgi:hypothetical protein
MKFIYSLLFSAFAFLSVTAQPIGNSIYFDGVSNYMEIANHSSINVSSGLTLEARIKPCSVTGHKVIMTKLWCSGAQNSYYFSVKDGKLRFIWFQNSCSYTGSLYESNLPVIVANTWQHVAVVQTSTSMKLFVNGVLVPSTLIQGSYSALKTSNQPIRVGAYRVNNGSMALHFQGEMDEVRVWSKAVSNADILSNYNSALIGNEVDLEGYFNLDNQSVGPNKNVPNNAIGSSVAALTKGSSGYVTPFYKNTNSSLFLLPDTVVCTTSSYTVSANMSGGSYVWQNGSTSSTQVINSNGMYSVTATNSCGTYIDSVYVTFASNPVVDLGNDTVLCSFGNFTLDATQPGATYQWSDGSISSTLAVSNSGLYSVTVTTSCGVVSDSIDITYNGSSSNITETSCDTYTSPSGNFIWTSTGTYHDTLVNSTGCDSVITVNLTVNSNAVTTISSTSCGGYNSPSGNYIWTNSGTYYDTIPMGNGCDILFTINLIVNASSSSINNIITCEPYVAPSGNIIWTNSGTYNDTIPNAAGCDSIMTFNLTVNQSTSSIISPVVCTSYTSPSGNDTWTSSGTYMDTIPNSVGCDSSITIHLLVNNSSASLSVITCNSYTAPSGAVLVSTGVYQDTIPNAAGCDSIITISLTLGNSSLTTDTVSSCNSYMWSVTGSTYLNSGNHTAVLNSVLGCDSVVILNLTITQPTTSSISITECDSYISPSGINTWTASGVYTDVIPNAAGCDSTITINLTINKGSNSVQTVGSCSAYFWAVSGITYSTGGSYVDTISNHLGCDSVITLNLTIKTPSIGSLSVTNCDNYLWAQNGVLYSNSGQYVDTITNSVGCDSIVTLNLTINSATTSSVSITACNNYSSPSGNSIWSFSGTYLDTLINSVGCDSIITTILTINGTTYGSLTEVTCDSYLWLSNNQLYTSSGNYYDTTTNSLGCDSIITLSLTINNSTSSLSSISNCGSYIWAQNGLVYSSSGVYSDTITNSVGCDSIISLNLTVNQSSTNSESVTSCENYTWPQNGLLYSASGQYVDTITNSVGCDSIVTLNLTINSATASSVSITACNNYTSPSGNSIWTFSGTYLDTLINSVGCDSIITTVLTINQPTFNTVNEVACDSFLWLSNNQLYTSSGNYYDTTTNSLGCDSIITLSLTISNSTSSSSSVTTCASYLWSQNGSLYLTSGQYMDTVNNSVGCDSIITLNLTINNSTSSTENISTCNSYTSPSGNYVWSTSGTYSDTVLNALGCDSIITTLLIINSATSSNQFVSSCESYYWTLNNQTLTNSGIYIDTIPNSVGCDSVITLNLTINHHTSDTLVEFSCGVYSAPDGSQYAASGQYVATIVNSQGCDSVITIDLTVNSIDTSVTKTGVDLMANAIGYGYQWLDCNQSMAPIPGATSRLFTASHSGNYAVEITDSICLFRSSCHDVLGVGVEKLQLLGVRVYPNPVDDELTVSNPERKELEMQLTDLTGKFVLGLKSNEKKVMVNFSNLQPGVYIIQVNSDDEVFVEKLVVR